MHNQPNKYTKAHYKATIMNKNSILGIACLASALTVMGQANLYAQSKDADLKTGQRELHQKKLGQK